MIKDISVAHRNEPHCNEPHCNEPHRNEPHRNELHRNEPRRNQHGMVSAEWAVGIIAAVAIAGVLLGIVTSGPIHDALLKFILMVINSFSGFLR
jgi:Protein of unknown function (DUF4244)